jgi:hypothetical protein
MRTTLRVLVVLIVGGCAARAGLSGEADNPLKKAKVGDWVSYSMVTEMAAPMAHKSVCAMKQTVKAKDERTVTLSIEMEVGAKKMAAHDVVIQLDQPYDPAATMMKQPDAKIEKLAQGQETVTVGGKQYACNWVQTRASVAQPGQQITTDAKIWCCSDVPLGGMVKMEAVTSMAVGDQNVQTTTHMELTGSGAAQ